jgi:ABC-type branched-subunit amino acid transport system ATPase component
VCAEEKVILPLDKRPVIVALAGSNGAGKTTFYPFKRVAVFENGKATFLAKPPPLWLVPLLQQNG